MLRESFTGSAFLEWMKERFDVVDINTRGDREVVFNEDITVTERKLVDVLNVRNTPSIIFLDASNRVVYRSDGYRTPADMERTLRFVDSKSYLTMTLNDYIAKTSDGPHYTLREDPRFERRADLAAPDKPVMVIFEDEFCDGCDLMHDTLLRDPVVNELLRTMTVVRYDAESDLPIVTPLGEHTTPHDWVRGLGLHARPGIVLFAEGVERVRIAGVLRRFHFQTALRYVAERQYQKYPRLRAYSRAHREALIAAGKVVDVGVQ